MGNGFFRLYVKRDDAHPWGLLQTFPYDDASRRKSKRRDSVLGRVRLAEANWTYNYEAFRSSSFCVEEQYDEFTIPVHIMGAHRERKGRVRVPGGLKRKPFTPKRKKKSKVQRKSKKGKK